MKKENKQAFTSIVLTLIALSFLGFFAINPTVTTIIQLRKELEDNRILEKKLEQKIINLSRLQQSYKELSPRIPTVLLAVPLEPTATLLAGKIQAIAQESGVSLSRLQIYQIELVRTGLDPKKKVQEALYPSFTFSLGVEGDAASIAQFLSSVVNFDRIITLDSFSVTKDQAVPGNTILSVQGKTYFIRE